MTKPQLIRESTLEAASGGHSLATGYGHTCVIESPSGMARCWGDNSSSQLGDVAGNTACSWMYNPSAACLAAPTAVVGNAPFTNGGLTQIGAGEQLSCARTAGSTVYCWGNRVFFGSGGPDPKPVALMSDPALTLPLANVSKVIVATKTVCALTTAQTVYCAGFNAFGQTGDKGPGVPYARPIPGLTTVKDIGAGDGHLCAVKTDGTVWCWGLDNFGQLGANTADGGVYATATPLQVVGENGTGKLRDVVAVSGGFAHTCALTGAGSVLCWGRNNHGQLGNSSTIESKVPVRVQGLP